MNNRITFKEMQVQIDATLIAYRARILHNQGYAPRAIADKLQLRTQRVRKYLKGVYCTAKTPLYPQHICPEASRIWGTPLLRYSGSKQRLRRNGQFHRDSYIPNNKRKER